MTHTQPNQPGTNPGPKLRLLFVDDEPAILASLRRSLRSQRDAWDMHFAESAAAALAQLTDADRNNQPFDVVVTDMRMPGMDGGELLRAVQQRWPQAIRFVLSGYSEQEMTVKLVNTAHQYLSKPCEPAKLTAALDRALQLRATLRNPRLQKLVTQLHHLPTPPNLYQQLTQQLADPQTTLDDVTATVQQDPAMTAKILQLVNSSFFGYASPVADLRQAVQLLGLSLLHALVLTIHLFEQAKRPHPATIGLQPHAFRVARLAKLFAQDRTDNPQHHAAAYTAGLLHDLGKLALAIGLPDQYAHLIRDAKADQTPLHQAEQQHLGADHAQVGAYLLGLWNLPQTVVEAVAFHHDPLQLQDAASDPAAPFLAVHAANALIRKQPPLPELLEHAQLAHRLDDWTHWAEYPPGAADRKQTHAA